ncbi:MAG: hypothetical protein ORN83_04980, partial [Chthoniobacteraceae bacterium]|nr:hypothetical protein [Chthoniobacteraceae bacterium]
AKADAAAAASGMSATTPAWPTNSDIASASEALSAAEPGPTQEAAQTTLSAAKDAAQSELENASEALSAAEPGPAQEAARKRLGDAKRALGLEEGGKRKTRHQTPKRRRSAKSKGRKGLSKKKTGSRK